MRRNQRSAPNRAAPEAEEEMPSTSAENIKALMPSAVENQMAISALNLFLNTAATKMPVKRADIVKQCLQGNNGRFAQILDIVTEWLLDIYGFSMHEIRDDKTSKGFICISNISGSSNVELTNEQRRNLKLLYLVLSYIYMKGESVLEAALFAFLRKVGIEDSDHAAFSDFQKIITEIFVKQLYLKREKVVLESGGTDERYQYQWGPRAGLEFTKKDILDSVALIMEKPVFLFTKQHEETYSAHNNLESDGGTMDTT